MVTQICFLNAVVRNAFIFGLLSDRFTMQNNTIKLYFVTSCHCTSLTSPGTCVDLILLCNLTMSSQAFFNIQFDQQLLSQLKCCFDGVVWSLFVGTLTVEQIYQDRDQFARLVREVAAPDVGRMGIEILSFTIKV